MIGVVANSSEVTAVREFFELFKTPWEFCQPDRNYEVVLCVGEGSDKYAAKLILVYAARELPLDTIENVQIAGRGKGGFTLSYEDVRIPIYGDHLLFRSCTEESHAHTPLTNAMYSYHSSGRKVVRIGYDLFAEVRTLLTTGQPTGNAGIPALELHIALLRNLIAGTGIPFAEIPPVPDGYRFIACLTHDVDHPMIRKHRFDRTMFGFLYRAIGVSLVSALRGRTTWRNLWTNWLAALKLPLVHLGLAKDYWAGMDRYAAIEGGAHSSFFVIPFKGCPGESHQGTAPSARSAGYCAADISGEIQTLASTGCEIGLHGIDAWADSSKGTNELAEIRKITGKQDIGVRMHWLYFDEQSPVILERAGADYDSTVGYNDTIGYRAGTLQAYRPLGANHLIELPMHVMDTALFFPGYLHLPADEAKERVRCLISDAIQFGGSLTVNWHDRSIAPERLWGDFYMDLVAELKARGAWLTTAGQAVAWFRKRRSAVFESVGAEGGTMRVKVAVETVDDLPSLQLRVFDGAEQLPNALIGHLSAELSCNLGQAQTVKRCAQISPEMQSSVKAS